MCVSTSLNTEDFVNRVDSTKHIAYIDRTTRRYRVGQANCMLSVVNHYACMALTTVLSQHFWCYLNRCLLDLDFWATISATHAWTGPVTLTVQCTSCALCSHSLQSVHCMVSTPHALSLIQHGNWTRRLPGILLLLIRSLEHPWCSD